MYFSARGHEVTVLDNFAKRGLELQHGITPMEEIAPLHKRVERWEAETGHKIAFEASDLLEHRALYRLLERSQPEAIIHYAEQPSAPYSMLGLNSAVYTQHNNVVGNLNLLFAMKAHCPDAHLIKLGTMGEYGTPNIDIEEGYITIEHNGRTDTLPFPKQPGSFYHLSKVHDSHNIMFACRIWGLRATDLNQGVVYGVQTDETKIHPELCTSFHYDDLFGTVLNRFCVQAVTNYPLTVYGKGGQTRGFLNILDTLRCVELSLQNPADSGEFRVFNQFTEQFSVLELAELVRDAAADHGIKAEIDFLANPRIELEEHYYNAKHTKLLELGLEPHLLSKVLVEQLISHIQRFSDSIDPKVMIPRARWRQD